MFRKSSETTAAAYVGSADPKDPRISPLYGDFSGFPPTLIQSGSGDGALRIVGKLVRVGNAPHLCHGLRHLSRGGKRYGRDS